jgi:hypothetical protein
MADKSWKQAERRGAAAFGTVRNSLSGGNSKLTRSDTLHRTLYIEQKYGKRHAVWTLYDDTRKKSKREQKLPVLLIHRTGSPGFLVVCHIDHLIRVAAQRCDTLFNPHATTIPSPEKGRRQRKKIVSPGVKVCPPTRPPRSPRRSPGSVNARSVSGKRSSGIGRPANAAR